MLIKYFGGLLLTLILSSSMFGQSADSEKIFAEGKELYLLEKASWNATDHFVETFADLTSNIGGYLSYRNEKDQITTIFFSRFSKDSIIVRYHFDDSFSEVNMIVDTIDKLSTKAEKELIDLKLKALTLINENADSTFSFYQNTSLNLIPIINENERKVYVLTGPQFSGYVLIGNDYRMDFDQSNEFISTKKLHNSLIQIEYSSSDGNEIIQTYHSHLVNEVIDVTDVCTLLLYKDYVSWTQHIVISDTYVSLLNLENETLLILTKEAWDKINDHQKNKQK